MSPWLIGFAVFFAYPLLSTVYFSFMHYDGFKPPTWSGTKNWTYVFENYPLFWPALRNTLWLVLVMVTLRVLFGLGIGLLITKIKTGTGVFRTLFYLPYLAPPVAATMAFAFLLNPGTGPVNSHPGEGRHPGPRLVQRPDLVQAGPHPAGAVGHRRPDGHLHGRAARRAEGAVRGRRAGRRRRAWQRFRYVTLPNISPIVMFAVVTGVIQTMQYYTQPLVAGKVASGVIQGAGHAVRARLPRQVDAHPAPARLQPRLPALRLRLRLCGRAGAVRPVHGVHRAADAAPGRPHPGR